MNRKIQKSRTRVISPGLYQFNVVIPANAPHGDSLLTATYNGYITQEDLLITVK